MQQNMSKDSSDNVRYKSFLNKSINSCANLMLSNVLLSNKHAKNPQADLKQLKIKQSCENPTFSSRKL